MRRFLLTGSALLVLVLAGCSGGASSASSSHPTATATPAPSLTVTDTPTVTSDSYGLPGATGYDTAASFHVRNSSARQAAVNVSYRLTFADASGKTLYTSDGTDTLSVPAGATQLVVYTTQQIENTPAKSASVTLYPASSQWQPASALPTASAFQVSGVQFQCPSSQVECEALGTLTYSGTTPAQGVSVACVAHAGSATGKALASGMGPLSVNAPLSSGQVAPFNVTLDGFSQPYSGASATLPSGPLMGECSVQVDASQSAGAGA